MTRFIAILSVFLLSHASFAADFEKDVRPVLQSLCFECHGAEKQKGDLRLDTLGADFATAEAWHDVLDQLNLGEMPPPKAKQPTESQREILTRSIDRFLRSAAEAKRFSEGRVTMRRLTRYEYANTMRDLLGIDLDYARELPPEPASPDGFLNNGATLEMAPAQLESYLKVARQALEIAIVSGDPPEVFRVIQTKTAVGNLPNRKDGGHEPVRPEFILDLEKFPRSGQFEVKIQANAAIPLDEGFPRMRVALGHVPGIIHVPRKTIGEVEIRSAEPQIFTFRARMEDVPQPGPKAFGRSGFKGMILLVDFLDADGNQLRYPDKIYAQARAKPKKGQKPKPLPKSPEFGSRLEIKIDSAEFVGPIPDPALLESQDAKREVRKLATRAFRRPVSDEELEPYFAFFEQQRDKAVPFHEAMRETLASILVSPHFLYIVENDAKETVSNFELATRLSYFLWSTMPDERLLELASKNKLKNRQILAAEVERMLLDPRSEEFVTRFVDQWFDLNALKRVAVDPNAFPNFKESLKADFRAEAHAVFAEILRNDLSALELLDSNWTMANRALAVHYQLPRLKSQNFQRVTIPANSARGGVLGQGAFHLAGSNGADSHPIKRAVWILDRLLDAPPASPAARHAGIGRRESGFRQTDAERAARSPS